MSECDERIGWGGRGDGLTAPVHRAVTGTVGVVRYDFCVLVHRDEYGSQSPGPNTYPVANRYRPSSHAPNQNST